MIIVYLLRVPYLYVLDVKLLLLQVNVFSCFGTWELLTCRVTLIHRIICLSIVQVFTK